MDNSYLLNIFIFLAAACIAVPIASRFQLGSVLGYLTAGVLIGPFGFGLIHNPQQIMHFAEFGIVMMLFLIGLELEPSLFWSMRKTILGLGGLQVIVTTLVFMLLGNALGFHWHVSLACAMALSLSSTALVLQMLQEKGLLQTMLGQSAFSVLLLQDLAVIPILIIMPLLSLKGTATSLLAEGGHALITAGIITSVIIAGKYLSRHLFLFIAQTHLREIFTATSLALVIGVTVLMQLIGISPALGTFIAGVVLANSEYKHTLESDIEPFKGLLLGLFFISIGMSIDFHLLADAPALLFSFVGALMLVKILLLLLLGYLFDLRGAQNIGFALAVSQGGEFAFVLFQYANGLHVLNDAQAKFLTLVVAISMALTPFLMALYTRYITPLFMSRLPEKIFDTIDHERPVILAGYGRFGQIIGRFMRAQGVKLTILENDPEQLELIRKFGNKAYFGDASNLDLLRNAGIAKAQMLIVAIDNPDKAVEIVRLAKQTFPTLKILARARNRRHAYELHKAGADFFRRETFDSAMIVAQKAMKMLGHSIQEVRHRAKQFKQHDEKTLKTSFAFFESEPELISFTRQASQELARILQSDIKL